MVSFKVDSKQEAWIEAVIGRALARGLVFPADRLNATMDLTALVANGCPMDWKGLLDGRDVDFSHDFWGIRAHLDRKTGKLTDFFVPRHARSLRAFERAKQRKGQ